MKQTFVHIGLLLFRLALGAFMAVHGWQKVAAYGDLVETFPDPIGMGSQLSLIAAIGAELGCSILIILGFATRLAAVPLAFTMVIALFVVHGEDPWKVKELAAFYLAMYVVLIVTGPGVFSLDHLLPKPKRKSKEK